MDFYALAQQCSMHNVENIVMAAIVDVESSYNPFAIGVVGGSVKQPRNYADAVATVRKLKKAGKNFSVGLAQVNKINFATYGLHEGNMFEPCTNLKAGSHIFRLCFERASKQFGNQYSYDGKLRLAASCYYSGNFKTGFVADFKGQLPYVEKFYNALSKYRAYGNQNSLPAPITQPQTQSTNAIISTTPMPNAVEITDRGYGAIVQAINAQKEQLQNPQDNKQKVWHSWDIFHDFE